jgi:hypothetical protein
MTKPTRVLVMQIVRRVFLGREPADVLAVLDRYGTESYHRERERVQLAILKLCEEEGRDDPAAYVDAACADYRDVLAWAESPNLSRKAVCTDPAERKKLIAEDRAQYQAWLAGR